MADNPDRIVLRRHRDLVGLDIALRMKWAVLETSGELSFIEKQN